MEMVLCWKAFRDSIREFEAANGRIEGEIQPDVNVKPAAKGKMI